MEMNGALDGYEAFIESESRQLETLSVPHHLWPTLYLKITDQVYDAGNTFEMHQVQYVDEDDPDEVEYSWEVAAIRDNVSPEDRNNIFLIDHAWTFQMREIRSNLVNNPGLLERMAALMDVEIPEGVADKREIMIRGVLEKIWTFGRWYEIGVGEASGDVSDTRVEMETMWYVLDEFGSRIQHDDEPSCRLVSYLHTPSGVSYTLCWPIKTLNSGDSLTCDRVENFKTSPLREYFLLPYQYKDFTEEKLPEVNLLTEDYFKSHRMLESLPQSSTQQPVVCTPLKVYSNIDLVNDYLQRNKDLFEIVDSEVEATVLWLIHHFKDYQYLSEKQPNCFVNQFPFENILTVKDLLAVIGRNSSWLPRTFNLVHELPQFVQFFQQREQGSSAHPNVWIVKPWNLGRGLGIVVTDRLEHIIRLCEDASIPKIVSEYISDPVLFYRDDLAAKVKFDVRYMILLHSVRPLKAFAYKVFWLRFANKEFTLNDFDDYEKHFTVMNYREESTLKQINCEDFVPMFNNQYPDTPWSVIEAKILRTLRCILESATEHDAPMGIAKSPQSRAIYAVDLMLEWSRQDSGEKSVEVKICEVNFSPDCTRACVYHPSFFEDVFSTLFLDKAQNVHNL